MNSGGHRGFTVVTIVVLIFAPFFTHHEWVWRFVGETSTTHVEQCVPRAPCPFRKVIVTIERLPIPPGGGSHGGNDQGSGNTGGGDQGGGGAGGSDQGGGGNGGNSGAGDGGSSSGGSGGSDKGGGSKGKH